MSLVVLSSEQQNSGASGQSFIEQPFSFKNYFQRPIKVPKDSAVALQSIRFQDSKTIHLGIGNNLHIYIGEELDRDTDTYLAETTSYPIVANFVSDTGTLGDTNNFPAGTVSVDDFAQRLELTLNKFTLNPQFDGLQNVIVEKNASTTAFNGFNIDFIQHNSSGTQNISEVWQTWTPGSSNFTWNNASTTLTRTTSKTGGSSVKFDGLSCAIGTEYPLSLAGGQCDFEWVALGGLYKDFRVGLTRPTKASLPAPPNYTTAGEMDNNFEYVVEMINETFKVYHMVNLGGDETQMIEINYDDAGNSDFFGGKYPAKRTGHKGIRFEVENEEVTIYLIENAGTTKRLIDPITTTNMTVCTKPLNQAQWMLYPKIELANQNQQMKVTAYSAHKAIPYGRSWYNGCVENTFRNGLQWLRSLEARGIFNPLVAQTRPYKGLVFGKTFMDVKVVMVIGDNLLYDPATTIGRPTNTRRSLYPAANVVRMLGFEPYSVIDSSYNTGTDQLTKFVSISAPVFYDVSHPLLVRLNGLPITTYNGAKSGTSKVIYSIGQYNSDSEGVVYLTPPQLIYIDIGNTEEISISQLGIDLVDIFEKFKTGITGKSIITLCIKPKEKQY